MFIKRVDGPRQITLPDGTLLTRADLPPAETKRWVISRKITVIQAVAYGLITQSEACQRYSLTEEEINLWLSNYREHGKNGLKVTDIQKYRQP